MEQPSETVTSPEAPPSREDLIALAHEVDSAEMQEEGVDSAQEPAERAAGEDTQTPVATTDDGKPPVNPETESAEQKEKRLRDAKTGRFLPKGETAQSETGAPDAPVAGEESAYARAKKDQERNDRSWQALEREKADTRKLQEELRTRERAINEHARQAGPQRAIKDGFTAPDYRQAAKDFTAAGDHANAFQAIQTAEEIERFEHEHYSKAEEEQIERAFNDNMSDELSKHPDAANPNSALSKEIMGVLTKFPLLARLQGGFSIAREEAEIRLQAASASGLADENKKLKAELERLTNATQPARGGPTGPSSPKPFESKSQPEQREQLIREAAEMDSREEAFA